MQLIVGQWTEHTVIRIDDLLAERGQLPHLVAEVRERAASARHLVGVERRSDSLRRGTRQDNPNSDRADDQAKQIRSIDFRIRIAAAERIYAIEDLFGTTVPELAVEKPNVVDGRCVARLDASHVDAADLEIVRVRYRRADIWCWDAMWKRRNERLDVIKRAVEDALGSNRVVAVMQHCRVPVGPVGKQSRWEVA